MRVESGSTDAGSPGNGCELRLVGGALARPFGRWQEQAVFQLPQAWQEAGAKPRGFQKESSQPGRWCRLVWAPCHPALGLAGYFLALKEGLAPQLGQRRQGCLGAQGARKGLGKAGDPVGLTLLHLA